jgi:5'-nucleotidase
VAAAPHTFRSRASAVGLGVFVFLAVVSTVGITVLAVAPSEREGTVKLRLIGINDFHGNMEPPQPGVGGAAAVGAWFDRESRGFEGRTIRVHAGDMVGASPLVSSHFHDEPSVNAMNLMDVDVGTLGNHEFDEGGAEALRLVHGGQRNDGRQFKRDENGELVNTSDPDFQGADFPYVAANTVTTEGELLLPPWKIVERDGVKVGFIGVTTSSTPTFLLERFRSPYRWLDISDTVNRYVPALRRQGAEAIVVLAHSGAFEATGNSRIARGEIVSETRQMSDEVDVVVAGHTHSHLNTRVGPKLVVEAWSYGEGIDVVDLELDASSGEVVDSSARTPRVRHDQVELDHELEALTADYVHRVSPLAKRVVGTAALPLEDHAADPGGKLLTLVADAQRAFAGTDLAITNTGATRGRLDAGPVTYEELFQVHAYENDLIAMTMSGADIAELLQQQWQGGRRVPLTLSGLTAGQLEPDADYTVVANELLVDSLGFGPFFDRGRDQRRLGTDLEALTAWVERLPQGFNATSRPKG